jgi:hypothetical protein
MIDKAKSNTLCIHITADEMKTSEEEEECVAYIWNMVSFNVYK